MCMPYRIDIWLETAAHYRDAADKVLPVWENLPETGDLVASFMILDALKTRTTISVASELVLATFLHVF